MKFTIHFMDEMVENDWMELNFYFLFFLTCLHTHVVSPHPFFLNIMQANKILLCILFLFIQTIYSIEFKNQDHSNYGNEKDSKA
ncbi:MAG: hypothetical protein EXX96DRAFT_310642 [Benjaminiella poitrasii]|nr:MAG: hypothetical protein EXX96DRAFT_310642 [Benjaminiella poitrasii]